MKHLNTHAFLSVIVDMLLGAGTAALGFIHWNILAMTSKEADLFFIFPALLLWGLDLMLAWARRDAARWAETVPLSQATWGDSLAEIDEFESEYDKSIELAQRVDPWMHQRQLMEMSGQRLPRHAVITRESMLYYGLLCEELSELGDALASPMLEFAESQRDQVFLRNMGITISKMALALHVGSLRIRGMLEVNKGMEFSDLPLTAAQAGEILDGTTDVAVVNSGFALATGLPGEAGYLECVGSNYSKANPDTGIIDKDGSGKWIKGRAYAKANFVQVLRNRDCILNDVA